MSVLSMLTPVLSTLKTPSYTHHRSFCQQYPDEFLEYIHIYLSLLLSLLLAHPLLLYYHFSTLPSSLCSSLMCFLKISSSAFQAFIFLHPPHPLISSSLLSLHFIPFSPLCVFRLVSSARPSYIPGMPATYGPHSSRSAERPTAPHRWPCRDQPKAWPKISFS